MGAPIQAKNNRRAGNSNNPVRNGFGKPTPFSRRPLNGNFPPFSSPPNMRPRGPFPPNRGGPVGMRPMMGPSNVRPPPPRGLRPPPPRLPRGPMMPPRMMGPGPRIPPPPPGMRPPMGFRPPPPRMMGMPPGPPPMRGMGLRRGPSINRRKFPVGAFKGVQKGRIMKKRKGMGNLDLSKEWVTEAMKEEFKKKEELLTAAKNAGSENKEAWATYRSQREKCSQIYHAAQMEFVGQQEEEDDWESEEEYDEESDIFFCDVCEQDFYSEQSYEKHVSEHKICGLDGCQYTAHANMIEKHIEMQHLTGLYEKIRSVNTPDEIAKWIEERKVKYPTKENVQRRYEKQEEMFKRGEKIGERKNRFGRDKTRISQVKKRPVRKKKKAIKVEEKPKESLIDEKCDWNGTMFPFRGTKELYNEGVSKEESDYEDEEWSLETAQTNKVSGQLNNALGALIGAYMSDDEEETADPDEAPTEEKIERQPVEYPSDQAQEIKTVRHSKKRQSCSGKKQCKKPKLEDKSVQSGFSRMKFFKRRVTLLEKLLDTEIRHERNVLLQCVQFVVSNNFFRTDSNTCVSKSTDVSYNRTDIGDNSTDVSDNSTVVHNDCTVVDIDSAVVANNSTVAVNDSTGIDIDGTVN